MIVDQREFDVSRAVLRNCWRLAPLRPMGVGEPQGWLMWSRFAMHDSPEGRAPVLAFTVALGLCLLLSTATALAERATVELKDGSVVSGELRSFVPGEQVAIVVGGKVVTIAAAEFASVTVGADTAPTKDAVPSRAVPAQREPRRPSNTSLTLPVTLLSIGGATMIAGGVFFALRNSTVEDCDAYGCYGPQKRFSAAGPAGMAFVVGGVVLSVVGLVVLPIRLMARNRLASTSSVDRAQRTALSPWLTPHGKSGTSFGLTGSFRF